MDKWNRMFLEKDQEPGSQGGEGNFSDEAEGESQDQPSNPTNTDTEPQTPFSNPALRGLTEEQIAQRLSLAEMTVKEQGRKITELVSRPAQPVETPVPSTGRQTPITEITAEDYWKNPVEATRLTVTEVIREQMGEIIQPFREDLARNKAAAAWNEVAAKHSDLESYRPWIEAQLASYGVTEPNAGTLEMLYLAAVGASALTRTPEENGERREDLLPNRPPPPQHPPSRQPIHSARAATKKLRELTENEKRMARERGWTDEEFLNWQEMDEGDVLTPEDK
jgi:hypothetical protein